MLHFKFHMWKDNTKLLISHWCFFSTSYPRATKQNCRLKTLLAITQSIPNNFHLHRNVLKTTLFTVHKARLQITILILANYRRSKDLQHALYIQVVLASLSAIPGGSQPEIWIQPFSLTEKRWIENTYSKYSRECTMFFLLP